METPVDVAQRLDQLVSKAGLTGREYPELVRELQSGREARLVKTQEGASLLHLASKHGWLDFMKSLIQEHDCNASSVTLSNLTPLHYACQYGHMDVVCYLINEQHCDPDCCDENQQTPLHWLCGWWKECSNGKAMEVVTFLVGTVKCNVEKMNMVGNTAFLLACRHGDVKIAHYLMSEGHCDVTVQNYDGDTALHAVCHNSQAVGFSKLLLEETKLDPSAKNNDGGTPLHSACWSRNFDAIQLLVRDPRCNPNEKNNDGDTALHAACQQHDAYDILTFLLEEAKVDPNVINEDGETPLDLALDATTIRQLIRHGANPLDVYKKHGHVLGKQPLQQPPQTSVKVLMMGNPSAGKSTLTKALQGEITRFVRLVKRSKRITGVSEKTTGIVPHEFESKMYGLVTLYDFAGQREFYGIHAALLQNVVKASTPILLLVVDLSESDESIKQNIHYWLSFLENQCTSIISKPHVVVIGSHADILKSRGENTKRKATFITSLLNKAKFSSLEFTGFIAMDCQFADSSGMTELRKILKTSCDDIRMQKTINFNAHCFLVYLLDKFSDSTAVTIKEIEIDLAKNSHQESESSSITYFLPRTMVAIKNVCDQLNDSGHLLVLKNTTGNSWVVINQTALLADVNGTIFAPEGFREHIQLASSTGVVPLSNIAKHFPQHDLNMLVRFLSHLEFCCEISDPEILGLISKEQRSTACELEERYFFFPGLVTLEVPSAVWEPQPQFEYHCGWVLQCSQPYQFFDPRFLQVLLLRLAFSSAFAKRCSNDIPSLQRKCCIWKNGIYWGDGYGVETLVEVTEQSRVVLLMRCPTVKSECLQLRSLLIRKVLAAALEFCNKVSTVESFINPTEVTQYPLKPVSQLNLYDMTAVATAVVNSMPSVVDDTGKPISLDSLLCFEPYADLGEPVLLELFNENSPKYKKTLSNRLIYSIAERIPKKKKIIKELFKPNATQLAERMSKATFVSDEHEIIRILDIWKVTSNKTLRCLREMLDQFSVFGGRNPVDIAGISGVSEEN